ncbi:MAG TPA: LysR family transcriptional regulator [Bacillota bacterium]|nr:LysR family transcriptional regulator [Bacillota bacterium]
MSLGGRTRSEDGHPDACGPSRWLCALRTFRTVVRERGFTAAARRLGISQGAVSQQMRCLEDQFGLRLLERSAHRVALTPAGARLLWHAERLLSAQDAMLAEMADLRPKAQRSEPASEILR